MRRAGRRGRRGGVYVLVVVTVAVAVALVLTGLEVSRSQRSVARLAADAGRAGLMARSALELGLARLAADPGVITTVGPSGDFFEVGFADEAVLAGRLIDPEDGNVGDDPDDELLLIATARMSTKAGATGARQMLRAGVRLAHEPMAVLYTGVSARGNVQISGASVTSSRAVTSQGNVTASSSAVAAPVEATGNVSGGAFLGSTLRGAPVRPIPTEATLLSTYLPLATPIDPARIPGGVIERVLLSPTSNPYGPTNPHGLYSINMGTAALTIRDCRIVGTLVIDQSGTAPTVISGSVVWEPAVAGWPALLLDHHATFATSAAPLSEALLGVNFNPISTPHEGEGDDDLLDAYSPQIRGIVWVDQDLTITGSLRVRGVVLGDSRVIVSSGASVTVTSDAVITSNPPPGFRAWSRWRVEEGSVMRVVEGGE